MIESDPNLSIRRQCELLGVSRSGLYYEPVATSADELALMRRIDELHLAMPFYGSRKIAQALKKEGQTTNRKCVQRLMRLMGLEALVPKPNTSRAAPEHPKYPYLLRTLKITRVNQVWATDISVPQISGVGDERRRTSRPLVLGLQEQSTNHRKRLGSKVLVVSVAEKVP